MKERNSFSGSLGFVLAAAGLKRINMEVNYGDTYKRLRISRTKDIRS